MAKITGKYEVLYVIDPAQGEEGIQALVEKFKAIVEDHGSLTKMCIRDSYGAEQIFHRFHHLHPRRADHGPAHV